MAIQDPGEPQIPVSRLRNPASSASTAEILEELTRQIVRDRNAGLLDTHAIRNHVSSSLIARNDFDDVAVQTRDRAFQHQEQQHPGSQIEVWFNVHLTARIKGLSREGHDGFVRESVSICKWEKGSKWEEWKMVAFTTLTGPSGYAL
ncbi:hypothetical protein BAUCODRAFT_145578 [Baudoinia panamericana UAMH 10762]|uniref:Uncharacterized protein n=1 Tax=Baudoinia panamericana (strain UAMH 10762) TaxID=717646 RepID=M2NLC7_BAUPA|nr:uncharacterized protein BAUCODRAFT_145578 [Baudoinia panamericana UAMH 10762]EMD00290.1 hypothetical protein BAUCODRAFT_145578 [Baudoinia panamericana UAMH 10762]